MRTHEGKLPIVIATSVVRGSEQGQSHGGIYLIDLEDETTHQVYDWNTGDIDFSGRGADRGLRGIAFFEQETYIAASDELFIFDSNFEILRSYRNRYLKHCHEISVHGDSLYLTSTGFDSILLFDLRQLSFTWGLAFKNEAGVIEASSFDPRVENGPTPRNDFHLNNILANSSGLYISGRKSPALMHFTGKGIDVVAKLPLGTHNAQPINGGLIYNDTAADKLRYSIKDRHTAFDVPRYPESDILNEFDDATNVARQAFGRGLCPVSTNVVVGGSSPSTVTAYDLDNGNTVTSVNVSMDIRSAIHGLELWPYPPG
ncbi:MAG: hypothetical protein DRR11_05280 [Gammaproteobacteria bacterium]|nr:MAG: hypothetical protein DRR11_05280 [Gammaproteobacteria bacterium]